MNLPPLAFVCVPIFFLNACATPTTPPSQDLIPRPALSPSAPTPDSLGVLWEDATQWDATMVSIRAGTPEGLDLYRRLRPQSDAGATDDLNLAIVTATEKNASGALLAIQEVDVPNVADCGKTDESDDDTRSAKALAPLVLPQLRARLAAIIRVKVGTIKHDVRLECVKELRRAKSFWEKALR